MTLTLEPPRTLPRRFSRALAFDRAHGGIGSGTGGGMVVGSNGDYGHFVTIDGRAVFISDASGHVPPRLQAESGAGKRFSKAGLQRTLIEHHRNVTGESDGYTQAMDDELTEAAGDARDAFTFHKQLPTEVKDAIADNPVLRSTFRVSEDQREAKGADGFAHLRDRYFTIAEAKAGAPIRAALQTARESQDPEMKYIAAIHNNLPDDPAALRSRATKLRKTNTARGLARAARLERLANETPGTDAVKAGGLRVGDKFTHGGREFRVAEDAGGMRVLSGPHEYDGTPVDAVSHVAIDKGSFRPGRLRRSKALTADDGIPFGRAFARSTGDPVTVQEGAGFDPSSHANGDGRNRWIVRRASAIEAALERHAPGDAHVEVTTGEGTHVISTRNGRVTHAEPRRSPVHHSTHRNDESARGTVAAMAALTEHTARCRGESCQVQVRPTGTEDTR